MLNYRYLIILLGLCLMENVPAHAQTAANAAPPAQPTAKQLPAIPVNSESFFTENTPTDGAPAFGTDLYGLAKTADAFHPSKKNVLQAHFGNDFNYKNEHSTQIGLASLQHLTKNLYSTSALTNRHLSNETYKTYYNLQTSGLLYKFDKGIIGLSYDHYTGDIDMNGFTINSSYQFDSSTELLFFSGKRPHNAPGAILQNVYEHFYALGLQKNINDRLTLDLGYDISNLSDGNQYKNYSFNGIYKLEHTNAYADSLLFDYSHGSYDKFFPAYDTPSKNDYYALGLRRDWPVYSQKRIWSWTTKLGTVRDNNEPFSFLPSTEIKLTQNISKNQQLTAAFSYAWYQKRTDAEVNNNRKANNYSFALDYSITL